MSGVSTNDMLYYIQSITTTLLAEAWPYSEANKYAGPRGSLEMMDNDVIRNELLHLPDGKRVACKGQWSNGIKIAKVQCKPNKQKGRRAIGAS